MIAATPIDSGRAQTWLDLGCGTGTFTMALAELLPAGSEVTGIDKTYQDIATTTSNDVKISFRQGDMDERLATKVDGILMANSLHYIKEKHRFLKGLFRQLKEKGQLIIVEYDTEENNDGVPYPISFSILETLLVSMNIARHQIKKTGERPSVYGDKMMYACAIDY